MRIDVGFGDVVFPSAAMIDYPTILDHAAPRLRAYSRESTIAEKFEAMVKLGVLNSRMKDFYDIWLLSRRFDFDGATLASAIEKTFANRGTAVEPQPTAFLPAFVSEPTKATQWQAFLAKVQATDASSDFASVINTIAAFLAPLAAAVSTGRPFGQKWIAPGPWEALPE
jgi:hypothetical protein